jgi:hypothetical protein
MFVIALHYCVLACTLHYSVQNIIFDFIVRQSTTNLMYDKVLKLYS